MLKPTKEFFKNLFTKSDPKIFFERSDRFYFKADAIQIENRGSDVVCKFMNCNECYFEMIAKGISFKDNSTLTINSVEINVEITPTNV